MEAPPNFKGSAFHRRDYRMISTSARTSAGVNYMTIGAGLGAGAALLPEDRPADRQHQCVFRGVLHVPAKGGGQDHDGAASRMRDGLALLAAPIERHAGSSSAPRDPIHTSCV